MSSNPEALLISAVVLSGEFQHLVTEGITSAMFYAHKDEMEWLEKHITMHNKAPDEQALLHAYPSFRMGKSQDVKHWCGEVRSSYKRQALIDALDLAMDEVDNDVEKAMSLISVSMDEIRAHSGGLAPDFDLFEDWQEVYDEVENRYNRAQQYGAAGIPTGFDTLDYITGGMQAGWFGVIAARLGQGKTWTGIRLGWEAAIAPANYKVTYFSLEQSRFQIATRLHAFGSRQYAKHAFNPIDLNKGTNVDLIAYRRFLQTMQQKRHGLGKFYINDTSRGRVTPSTIAHVIESRQPDIVIIDYLTLLGMEGDDWRAVAKLSSELQGIAQSFNIPIIALSQVNRVGASSEPPGAEHLSQADAIGQDADIVLTQVQRSKRVMKMKLAKFRHGPAGDSWFAKFDPGNGDYEEVDANTAEDLMEEDSEED